MNTLTNTSPPGMPASEYAIRERMSRERVVRLIHTGRLPGYCKSQRWYVTAADVPADLQLRTQEAA